MEFDVYTSRAEDFLTRYHREYLDFRSGRKGTLELVSIYEDFDDLFQQHVVEALLKEHKEATGGTAKRRRYLLGFVTNHIFLRSVLAEDEELARLEATSSVLAAGESIPMQKSALVLANEGDRGRRKAIYDGRLTVIENLNTVRARRWAKVHHEVDKAMGKSYAGAYAFLHRVHFETLKVQIENFLSASESYFVSRLTKYAQELLGMDATKLEAWDLPRLLRGASFDEFFPEGKSLSILKRTLLGLGFDLKKQQNVRIDSEDRPGKFSLPFCTAPVIPDEVHLVLRPHGGVLDYLILLHETGHALLKAYTSPEASFEYRYLGDEAVGETYGFLLQYLTINEEWLTDYLKIPSGSGFRDWNQFRKLYLLRRAAARFLFELHLHGGTNDDGKALEARYANHLETALHVPFGGKGYLRDLEDGLPSVSVLRAWVFEAELRQVLTERFGVRWYSRPSAGDFLAGLWTYGSRYGVEELAPRIRYSSLDFGPISREVQ